MTATHGTSAVDDGAVHEGGFVGSEEDGRHRDLVRAVRTSARRARHRRVRGGARHRHTPQEELSQPPERSVAIRASSCEAEAL
jgi:hypothetical protein